MSIAAKTEPTGLSQALKPSVNLRTTVPFVVGGYGTVRFFSPHPLACEFLRDAVLRHPDFGVPPGPACSEARDRLRIAVVDIGYPQTRGLLYAGRWDRTERVIAVDEHSSDDDLEMLYLNGIAGYLTYTAVHTRLAEAVKEVLHGNVWYPASIVKRSAIQRASGRSRSGTILTLCEMEVIGLLRCGTPTNKEIAAVLGISERTVRFHLHNIFAKLRVADRHQAAQLALDLRPESESAAHSEPLCLTGSAELPRDGQS